MSDSRVPNVWLIAQSALCDDEFRYPQFISEMIGPSKLYTAVVKGDWLLLTDVLGVVTRVACVLRVRSSLKKTTLYFDRLASATSEVTVDTLGLSRPANSTISRLQWSDFVAAVPKIAGRELDDVPLIEDQAYIRELLQLAVIDDLLGPANGPHEQILDMGVRDRYLVGKLAPREAIDGGVEGAGMSQAAEAEDEPGDLIVHKGRHDPGAEFDSTDGRVDAEADASDEIDASSNQSLIPSSFGMTFCVDGDVKKIEVDVRWGQYVRVYEHEHTKSVNKKIKDSDGNLLRTEQTEVKVKVWQRVPCGGKRTVDLVDGIVPHDAPDPDHPEVRLQGAVRPKNANGDRLVTLFLLNTQKEPEENKDAAWVFQPELSVCAVEGTDKAIFRRRMALTGKDDDAERKALEMIYREEVEFAVGHGVAVHARTDESDRERADEVRTVVMPQHEVPITETPGLRPDDRPAMREMAEKGHLDMESLATMDRGALVGALSALANDYGKWIDEQASRIGTEVVGHDGQAASALARCAEIKQRLLEGIAVLADDGNDKALSAFRFANRAMARQRVHSLFALSQRRGENKPFADFDQRKNRSWRAFQIAFILLSIPSLADPTHKDRTQPVEAYADLLWFPTGGGKTEAYLGVAAFAMAVRRLQGKLGGYDGSRGLTVIMRYTLRLLTLQQFQRASTLICAMYLMRQEAAASGDKALGDEPFTIGLWVGNKVTPGTTQDSHKAIEDIRNPEKFDAGGTSPAQLTACPWCGY
jgi:hypothetical protein